MDLALAADLDEVNAKLAAAIKGLETALRADMPDLGELSRRRIALARTASERLRFLNDRVFPVLTAGPTPAHAAAARMHDERVRALFGESTKHIGAWGSRRIAAEWSGYVTETRAMIARAEAFMATEGREIYPLLATLARAA